MRVTVEIKGDKELIAELRRLKKKAEQELTGAALDGAEVIQNAANRLAPGPHIEVDVVSADRKQATVDIGPDEDHWYYRFFETGAVDHPIDPNDAPMLHWVQDDEDVFALEVQHPGMEARPFLRPAIDEKKDNAVKEVKKSLRRRLGL